jgi:hypothetical protein
MEGAGVKNAVPARLDRHLTKLALASEVIERAEHNDVLGVIGAEAGVLAEIASSFMPPMAGNRLPWFIETGSKPQRIA